MDEGQVWCPWAKTTRSIPFLPKVRGHFMWHKTPPLNSGLKILGWTTQAFARASQITIRMSIDAEGVFHFGLHGKGERDLQDTTFLIIKKQRFIQTSTYELWTKSLGSTIDTNWRAWFVDGQVVE